MTAQKEKGTFHYTIMIVDDEPANLSIGKALLEKEYKLQLMRSGVQALGLLKKETPPDLILLDIEMPGLDGFEVLDSIKKDERFCNIPVILVTDEYHIEEEIRGYQAGAIDFIYKPINPEILKVKVKQQIRYLELQRENARLKSCLGLFDQFQREMNSLLSR